MNHLILSTFSSIDLLGLAFKREGFCVVSAGDIIWGSEWDIHSFHPPKGKFEGIIGGPPCQRWSQLAHMVRQNGYKLAPDLIPEFVRVVEEAEPEWFLMENVLGAPIPVANGYAVESFLLNNRWVGGEQRRLRRFSWGSYGVSLKRFIEFETLEPIEESLTVCAKGGYRQVPVKMLSGQVLKKRSRFPDTAVAKGLKEMCRLQGLPENFLDDAPFTVAGKQQVIGNGVPLLMGRAIAKAVKKALEFAAT